MNYLYITSFYLVFLVNSRSNYAKHETISHWIYYTRPSCKLIVTYFIQNQFFNESDAKMFLTKVMRRCF
jgi:hypothetical protein